MIESMKQRYNHNKTEKIMRWSVVFLVFMCEDLTLHGLMQSIIQNIIRI